jgi:hypothetical protein
MGEHSNLAKAIFLVAIDQHAPAQWPAFLEQAVAAGYKNAAHMKQDKDLDALRDRADFTKLVTMLQGIRAEHGIEKEECR